MEPCLPDFSRLVNEEIILVNEPMFSKEALQEYVTHPEKKFNKHRKIQPTMFLSDVLCVTENTI